MSFINVFFTLNGKNINMQANSNDMFAELALRYMQKAGIQEQDAPKFFFSSRELILSSAKTLAEYNIHNNAKIDVVPTSTVIGA